MKLTITASALADALDVAESAAVRGKTAHFPWMAGVLLDAREGDRLTVSGTDLRVRAWRGVQANIEEAGAVVAPVKALSSFLEAVPADIVISVTADHAHKVTLKGAGITAKAAGWDWEEFPPQPDFNDPAADLTMAAPLMARLIGSVVHAAADNDSRPVLAGVLFRYRSGTLSLVAADGFRMAVRETEIDGSGEDFEVIVHAAKLAEVAKQLARATSVRLIVDSDGKSVMFDAESGCFTVATIDGQFPDVARIIPKPDAVTTTVTVARADMLRAIELVRAVERDVRTKLHVTDNGLTVEASDSTNDHAVSADLAADHDGEPQAITFQGTYVRDAVRALEGDRVTLEIVGKASPALVREAGERGSHSQLVMPMQAPR